MDWEKRDYLKLFLHNNFGICYVIDNELVFLSEAFGDLYHPSKSYNIIVDLFTFKADKLNVSKELHECFKGFELKLPLSEYFGPYVVGYEDSFSGARKYTMDFDIIITKNDSYPIELRNFQFMDDLMKQTTKLSVMEAFYTFSNVFINFFISEKNP